MALTYAIVLTDSATAGDGTGPYTVTVLSNPTTAASGGTTKYSNTNALGTLNILELAKLGVLAAVNANATANQVDSTN